MRCGKTELIMANTRRRGARAVKYAESSSDGSSESAADDEESSFEAGPEEAESSSEEESFEDSSSSSEDAAPKVKRRRGARPATADGATTPAKARDDRADAAEDAAYRARLETRDLSYLTFFGDTRADVIERAVRLRRERRGMTEAARFDRFGYLAQWLRHSGRARVEIARDDPQKIRRETREHFAETNLPQYVPPFSEKPPKGVFDTPRHRTSAHWARARVGAQAGSFRDAPNAGTSEGIARPGRPVEHVCVPP